MRVKIGQKLDFKQEMKALTLLLGLCPECAADFERLMAQMGTTPGKIVREVFWNWRADWPHGQECPPEELAKWNGQGQDPVRKSEPEQVTAAVSPSDAGAVPVGVGAAEEANASI